MPQRPCLGPGRGLRCPFAALVQDGSRCPTCASASDLNRIVDGTKRSTTAAWSRLRAQVLDRDGHRCQMCGKTESTLKAEGQPLEVHHIDGNHNNNDLSNLQALCRMPCHRRIAQPAARKAALARSPIGRGRRR